MKEQEKEMKRLKRKREEKVVWKNKSCEFQYKYNDGVKDWIVEDLRRELERKFAGRICTWGDIKKSIYKSYE